MRSNGPCFAEGDGGPPHQRGRCRCDRIRRAVRGADAKPADKIESERVCWSIIRDLTEMLQKLGYLPSAAIKIRGDVKHSLSLEAPRYDELLVELERLEEIQVRHGKENENGYAIDSLKDEVRRLALGEQIDGMAKNRRSRP